MPIAALPAHTVRALGSAQALTDSSSLVKELLDNAIDGKATSISVEISANTLAEIRMKDNGHGINPDDRPMVCQRHCTSKIRDLEELRTIGGRSLGFRGVALASAAELSGCLTISTRIEGEETASELVFDRQGRLVGEKRASLPVGTIVRIEKFLEALPIRKKSAEKTSIKTLVKLKRTLQAYAIARPHLRISMKILKAKDEKANWKYPIIARVRNSKSEPSIFDAARDVIGKQVTEECNFLQSTWSSEGEQIHTAVEDLAVDPEHASSYTFQAVLAKMDCDRSMISNIGTYLSVDSRPVSCERGTLKQIVSIYKSYLRSLSAPGTEPNITNPCLCMNIICPPGSYDVNVEPAKNDVLFANADLVIRLVESLFTSVYGELKSILPSGAEAEKAPRSHGIELMLARKNASPARESSVAQAPQATSRKPQPQCWSAPQRRESSFPKDSGKSLTSASPLVSQIADEFQGARDDPSKALIDIDPRTGNEHSSTWGHSMYGVDEGSDPDELPTSPAMSTTDHELDEERALKSIQVSNPWAFAKLNAPRRAHHRQQQQAADVVKSCQMPTPRRQAGDAGNSMEPSSDPLGRLSPSGPDLPTPGRSQYQDAEQSGFSPPASFPFPLRARGKRKVDGSTERLPHPNCRSNKYGSLNAWVQSSHTDRHEHDYLSDDSELQNEGTAGPADVSAPGPFVSARTLPRGTPLSDIPDISEKPGRKAAPRRQQQQRIDKESSVPPVRDLEKVWFDVGEKPKRKQFQQANTTLRQQAPISLILREDGNDESRISSPADSPHAVIHPDLALTLDYESRKQLATQQHRDSLRRVVRHPEAPNQDSTISIQNTTVPTPSPHQNRQRAAIAALHTSADPSHCPQETPIFAPDDPRAYLIRTAQPSSTSPQNPGHHRPFKRTKTALLPFETPNSANYIGHLTQHLSIKSINLGNLLKESGLHDGYIRDGIISEAFPNRTAAQVREWEAVLKEMVKKQYRIEGMAAEEEMDGDLECNLAEVLQRHEAEIA